eukprot:2535244-Pyramimonas_sp.AAC.1
MFDRQRRSILAKRSKLESQKQLLTFGSYCSGMGCDVLALELRGIPVQHVFAADIKATARTHGR